MRRPWHVVLIAPRGSSHWRVFEEPAALIRAALVDLGFDCTLAINRFDPTRVNVTLGYHLLTLDQVPTALTMVPYQMEQLGSGAAFDTPLARELLRRAAVVWDFSPQNVETLAAEGIAAVVVPIGYHRALEIIPDIPEADLSILFSGAWSPRRTAIVERLQSAGLPLHFLFGVYGREKQTQLARAQIHLHIHSGDGALFQQPRIAHLLNNRRFVISEIAADNPYPLVDLVQVPAAELVDVCRYYLDHPEERAEIAERNYQQFREHYPMTTVLGPGIDAVARVSKNLDAILDSKSHIDLVASVVKAFGHQSYLEIGCQNDLTFNGVDVPRKVGVDPARGGTLRMRSDEYFATHGETFDAIFIDGDHHHAQVLQDAVHALRFLNPGGTLLLHDCSPPDVAHEAPMLCCTAWRAFASLRQRPDLDGIVADWDFGTAILRVAPNPSPIALEQTLDQLGWADFNVHRRDWMRLSNRAEVRDWLAAHLERAGPTAPSGRSGIRW